jgi:hypothetical protein
MNHGATQPVLATPAPLFSRHFFLSPAIFSFSPLFSFSLYFSCFTQPHSTLSSNKMMTMTMTKPAVVAAIWLLGFHGRVTLTDGFSHTKTSSTPILDSGRDHGRQLRSIGLDDMNMSRRGEEEIIDDVGSSSRRLFIVSVFGAASMIAFSEDVAADSTDRPWQEPIQFTPTLTIETSTTINALKNDAVASTTTIPTIDTRGIIEKAAKKALGGGKAGAAAAVVQVLSLMWLRTSMNYQYRFGERLSEISCFCMGS